MRIDMAVPPSEIFIAKFVPENPFNFAFTAQDRHGHTGVREATRYQR
jgi:hypothetical protein